MSHANETLARRSLLANAAFSTVTGLLTLLAADALAPFMGLDAPWVLRVIGGGLLPFAWIVSRAARRPELDPTEVLGISFADLGWVAGTIGLGIGWPSALGLTGWVAAATVAAFVAAFAAGQLAGLARARAGLARHSVLR
jgi:hypothetical protein